MLDAVTSKTSSVTDLASGVAAFIKPAAVWLRDGDTVEIEIERIGKITNKMVFEK